MKILHLIYDDPDNPWLGGGGAIRTLKINRILAKKHDLTIVCGAYPKSLRDEKKDGIRFIRIGSDKNYSLSRITYSLMAKRYIRTIKHDLLVEDFSGNSPTFSPIYTNKPSVAVLQNFFGTNILKKKLFMGIIPWLYERFFIRRFDRFISVNKSIMHKFIPILPEQRYRIIPQGIDAKDLVPKSTMDKFILFVGRLDFYQKGIDILLKSLSLISDLGIKLVIIGGGDRNKLEKMAAAEKVTHLLEYHPRLTHDKIIKMYRNAYCLALASRYEGWPLVCLESYSQAKPVVGTDIAGLESVLQNGITGLKVEKNNVTAFANALRRIIINKRLRKRLGSGGKRFAMNFIWEKLAQSQEKFYMEIITDAKKKQHI